ncbi:hypothetical protein C8R47DRAFT_1219682 [Mycena vitilis]|nr:hypothetical protein C8R47DRAFT_1219682 [Mycena vitilis]
MLASYAPQQSVPDSGMSTPLFKAQTTRRLRPAPLPSRSLSFYGDDLRPHDFPPRATSPAGSFYSQSSSSSRSIDSASSSGSRRQPPTPPSLPANWLARSPRPPVLSIVTPSVTDFASPPETPVEIPEAELRRRQLEKATRLLGESVPLELVFQPRHPLVNAFPDPPPRRSTESPQPGEQPRPRAALTERRRPAKLARRASLSLSTFASKFRTGSHSTNHSRDSSQESASSDHSQRSPVSANATFRTLPRRGSAALGSPIVFAFPRRSPTRAQTLPPSPPPPMIPITPHIDSDPDLDLVLDIRSTDPSAHDHDGSTHGHGSDEPDAEAEAETTPVREHPRHVYSVSDVLPLPRPRIAPLPTHSPARSESHPVRPETPFADYASARPETPFAEYLRPATPFTDLAAEDEPNASVGYLAPTTRKERGQGWSGEWNQPDMRDVIQRLRALR